MKKSVRDMGKIERRFHTLTFKSLVTVVLTTLFIGLIILVAGYLLYFFGVLYEYRVNTCNLAKAEAVMLDKTDARQKAEEVLKIYDGIPEKQKGDGTGDAYHKQFDGVIDDTFRGLQEELRLMQNEIGLRNAFLVAIDEKNKRMIYIVDADPNPETVCHPGTWDAYTTQEIGTLVNGGTSSNLMKRIGVRNDYQATITNTDKYGFRCTGGETVFEVGDYTIMVCLDEKLDHMVEVSNLFLLRYALLLLVVIVIAGVVTLLIIRRGVVKPIDLLAGAARGYTEDKHNGIAVTDRFSQVEIRRGDEIEELDLAMKEMEKSLTEYEQNLTKATAERERISTELNLARKIQMDTLPRTFPAFPDRSEFDIYASMDPAKEVGGDFYDFLQIDEDHLGFLIADVSGKGIPASLFMMTSKVILDNLIMAGFPPSEVLRIANNAICASNREDMFVTVSIGIMEISTGKIMTSNAGHENPVKITRDGVAIEIKNKHGFIIGGLQDMKYEDYEIKLDPGDKLFLYTDGVTEATNSAEEAFSMTRLLDTLGSLDAAADPGNKPAVDPKKTLEDVRSAVDEFVGDAKQFDDITMLCLQYYGK